MDKEIYYGFQPNFFKSIPPNPVSVSEAVPVTQEFSYPVEVLGQ